MTSKYQRPKLLYFLQILIIGLGIFVSSQRELLAATKIFLHDAYSKHGTQSESGAGYGCAVGANDYTYRLADINQGASTVTKSFAPTATAPPCRMQTANGGGEYLTWVTPPLSAAATISGNINYSVGCQEAQTSLNLGFRFVVARWSAATGGIVSTVHTSANSTECGTTMALRTIAAAAPTSTAFRAGDKIVIYVELRASAGWGGNGTRAASLGYDGTAAGTRDSFVNFVDDMTFAADAPGNSAYVK